MKLSARSLNKSHRVLLFGPPKSGKTYLAGKLAAEFDLLWFDLENGIDSLFQLPESQQARIEVISLPDTRDYPIAIETCLKIVKGGPIDICEAHGKVTCMVCRKESAPTVHVHTSALPLTTVVVFDSLTQLTNSAIAFITKHQPDDYKLEYDDWAKLGKLMDTFLSSIQQAGYHVICISHETEVEMEDGKQKLVPTAGTRNFSRNTAKYFDEVIYCEVKNKQHVAASSTLYNGSILTGSRSGSRLELQQNASLIPIFKGDSTALTESKHVSSIVNQDTPAHNALSALERMRARMQAPKG